MKRLAVGILAHVDAGKTTLSEAMLYAGGMIRHLGRVDKGDAFLDTYELEKKRGITIFSKQARLAWDDMDVTLLDTPGHVDFSAEMERVLQVLDYAVLVISGSDGVQGHTRTLWRLLARYQIPAFLFINKMDLAPEQEVLRDLKESLGGNFVDFGADGTESFYEEAAVSGEAELEEFLETGQVSKDAIRSRIASRDLFPCYFGSALKNTGVEEFMRGLEEYTLEPVYPDEFGAKIFKIVRDSQGERLTYMKITGGVLLVCGPTSNGDGAFDYDLTATVTGGTVLMVGSNGMAQNFTSGEQPFAFATVSGSAGQNVAVVDSDGTVVASFTAAKQFGMVLATSPAFVEGGTYSLVIGGTVTGANADGYTDSGTVEGGSTTEIAASTTASGGMGGLGAGGGGMPAGQGGDVQRGMRGGAGSGFGGGAAA